MPAVPSSIGLAVVASLFNNTAPPLVLTLPVKLPVVLPVCDPVVFPVTLPVKFPWKVPIASPTMLAYIASAYIFLYLMLGVPKLTSLSA